MSETTVEEPEKAGEDAAEGGGDEEGEVGEDAGEAAEAHEAGEAEDVPAAGPVKKTSGVSKRNLAEAMASIALGGTNLVLRPAVVRYGDMPKAMENYCIELAHLSMMKFYKENEMARPEDASKKVKYCRNEMFIKKSVEDKYKDLWHVLVGKNFGLSVTHEEKRYIYFYCGQMAFVIFKAGMPF